MSDSNSTDDGTHSDTEAGGVERSGLYSKYEVRKDGEVVEDCFVLEPESDPAAWHALSEYARRTDDDGLANDLRRWIDEIEGHQGVDQFE